MKYIIFCIMCVTMLLLVGCRNTNNELQKNTDHVLTILARNRYDAPIRQAEQNLIAEWAQRPEKEGHTFRIELTTFAPEDELSQLTRLDTMLMAGQGYDIFFPVVDHRHIRDYAQSGFIADIYPLIENCPNTDINDFFANALRAWEINDGLYVFPWDFNFSHAFINSDLPQALLDRFARYKSVTVAQLVDIYSDLLHHYGDDFGHFNFSHGSTLHHPSRIIVSYMNNFIDFGNRTVTLTDEAFVAFLTNFTTTFGGQQLEGQDRQYWTNWWTFHATGGWPVLHHNAHSLRLIARGANSFTWGTGWHAQWRWDEALAVTMPAHAFMVESREFYSAAAFMHENVFKPYFEQGIPLVNERGELLIADNTEYPAGISISSAANGAVAWDFSRHLINAFNRREAHSTYMLFYQGSLAVPIVRDLFSFRLSNSLANAYDRYMTSRMFPSIGTSDLSPGREWIEESIESMLPHIAALAEQPMALSQPPIPDFLYIDNLELLLRGLITPQDFAQRTQNAVSLWLIGG